MNSAPLSAPPVAFIGCGRVATTLAQALRGVGWPLAGVAARRRSQADDLAACLGCPALAMSMQEAVDRAELVLVTVSDDAIAEVVGALNWRRDLQVAHCSGATELTALSAAAGQGARVGGFHPLQIFSDPLLALERLPGSSVAVEAADPVLEATLGELALRLGLRALRLPAGGRARYHAAAGFAASGLLSVLEEARHLWSSLGWDEQALIEALVPLSLNTLHVARSRGLGAAVSGPVARGDAGVIGRQRRDLAAWDTRALDFYDALAQRQLRALERARRLDATAARRVRDALAAPMSNDGDAQSD